MRECQCCGKEDNTVTKAESGEVDLCKDCLQEYQHSNIKRIMEALNIIVRFGGIDEAHHKSWVIDQVTRILTGERYECFVKNACNGEDGPDTYDWDEGIIP